MTDWREHNGKPQPVGDDDWLEVLFPGTASGWMARAGNRMAVTWKGQSFKWRFINQHLIDAALKRGIELGLGAAHKAIVALDDVVDEAERSVLEDASMAVCAIDPETIANEAKHD